LANTHPSGDSPSIVRVVTSVAEIVHAAAALASSSRVAFDLESNGLFAFRPAICMIQLAGDDGAIVIVDPLAAPVSPLEDLLGPAGPIKIVHDVSFDARMLAEIGVALGNVHDTSIAARMLGRAATGLASLLASELGITMDKALQHHDWRVRPLEVTHLAYLAKDVAHLAALDDVLWGQVRERGIEEEVLEETRYRLASAIASIAEPDRQPGWTRLKGIERASAIERGVARRLWEARDREASRLDVPPYKVLGNEAIIDIAKARPTTRVELSRVRGASHGRAQSMGTALLAAIAAGIADGDAPEEERAWLERPRLSGELARARRVRETRLMAWRKAEAARRGVDEQVILPGHCVKDLAEPESIDEAAARVVPGFGACRAAYAPAIVLALRAPPDEKVGE
jgi:ribonuclease D